MKGLGPQQTHKHTHTHAGTHTAPFLSHTKDMMIVISSDPSEKIIENKKVSKKQKLVLNLGFNQTASRSKDVSTAGVFRDGLDFFFFPWSQMENIHLVFANVVDVENQQS